MIKTMTLIRMFILSYMALLIRITNYWPLTILPKIFYHNLGITSPKSITNNTSFYFASFLYGGITGAFTWPYVTNFLSKRNCILISITLQGILNTLSGCFTNVFVIFTFRFLIGVSYNLNTVGKAFLIEVCEEEYQQFGFILNTCFSLFGVFVSPLLGLNIYNWTGQDYRQTCFYLFFLYLIGIISFLIFFYVFNIKKRKMSMDEYNRLQYMKNDVTGFYGFRLNCSDDPDFESITFLPNKNYVKRSLLKRKTVLEQRRQMRKPEEDSRDKNIDMIIKTYNTRPKYINPRSYIRVNRQDIDNPKSSNRSLSDYKIEPEDEEEVGLIKKQERIKKIGLFQVLREISKPSYVRNLTILTILSTCLHKTQALLSVLYLELEENKGGFGFKPYDLSVLSFYCYFPSLSLLLLSPFFVPRKVRYKSYIKTILCLYAVFFCSFPFIKNIEPIIGSTAAHYFVYSFQGLNYTLSPRIYSPFLNYLINKDVKRRRRTAVNSINYILSTFFSAFTINIITYIYSVCVVNTDTTALIASYGKFLPFLLFLGLCLFAIRLLD